MNICVMVRTRDEAHRIGAFCRSYDWADTIIVADGGSQDETVPIAALFPNVIFRPFSERVEMQNGYWRNNDSAHVNHLIACAHDLTPKPDWLILDDCDIRPNSLLRGKARSILESTPQEFVNAVRLYLWGLHQHFPHMAKPESHHDIWEPSLWAWRESIDFWTVNLPPAFFFRIGERQVANLCAEQKCLDLLPPYCLLHYSWDDPERVNWKIKVYRESGLIPAQAHPIDFAGPLEILPDWAQEDPEVEGEARAAPVAATASAQIGKSDSGQ